MSKKKEEAIFEILGNIGYSDSVSLSQLTGKEIDKKNAITLSKKDFKDKDSLTKRLKELPEGTIIIIEDIKNVISDIEKTLPEPKIFKIEKVNHEMFEKYIFVEEKPFSKFRRNANDFKHGRNRKLRRY